MDYIRTKTLEFSAVDPKLREGDRAIIHGISVGEFMAIQRTLAEARALPPDNEVARFEAANRANMALIAASCHELTLNGRTFRPSLSDIEMLDMSYYDILLQEVMKFHEFTKLQKN